MVCGGGSKQAVYSKSSISPRREGSSVLENLAISHYLIPILPQMSDPLANQQLDLACQVGSRDDIIEAIEDGADINHSGSSPIILAIMANDRDTVGILVELGADLTCFELKVSNQDAIVDELMKGAPGTGDVPEEDPVDAKLLRAFDKMIRNKGLGEPFTKKRGGEFPAFLDGLKWIAAEDCHGIVEDFLKRIEPSRTESGDIGVDEYLKEFSDVIQDLSAQYAAVTDLPTELLKEYLKERKKLLKA